MSEIELKSRVTQLEVELEKERTKFLQFQQEKVKDEKAIEEKAKQQIVQLKKSFENDKESQIKSACESVSKEYEELLKVTKSEYEEKLHLAETNLKKERLSVTSKLKEKLHKEIEQELATFHAMELKKNSQEFLGLSTQVKAANEEISSLKATIKNKDYLLQEKEKELRTNAEKLRLSERKASKQLADERENHNRQMQSKDKELSQLSVKLDLTKADKDQLTEDLKKLKNFDVRGRRSTTPTSPSLSPSTSVEELTAISKQVSKRERDMVIRNSELSFRVRTIESSLSAFREENSNLKQQLAESRSQLAPIKESKDKLNKRINELNVSLRSSEKKVGSLSQEILKLKSAKQQLEEEHTRQRKSLQQQLTKTNAQRTEIQKLNGKIETLTQKNERLLQTTERLESDHSKLEQQMRNFMLTSPIPLSPPPSTLDDDDACSVCSSSSSIQVLEDKLSQIEFDKDETEIKLQEVREKYDEMKLEYSSLRSKYKALRTTYETTQQKMRDIQAGYKEELNRREQLETERLGLEGEIDMLRRASHSDSSYDQDREEVTVESLQIKVDGLQEQVDELEVFVCDQDTIWLKQEEVWAEEKNSLESALEQLKNISNMLTEENKSLALELKKVRDSSQCWKEEKETLTLAFEQLQQTYDQLVKEKEILAVTEQVKQASNHDSTQEIEESNLKLIEQLNEALNKLAFMEKEENRQKKIVTAKNRDLADLESMKTKLKEDLDMAAENITSLQQKITQLETELENEVRTNFELQKDLDNVKNELCDKKKEFSVTSEKLAQLQSDESFKSGESVSTKKRDESAQFISEQTESLQQLTKLDQQYKKKLKEKEEDNEALQDSLSLAQSNITVLNELLENLQSTLLSQKEEHLSYLNEKEEHIQELNEQIPRDFIDSVSKIYSSCVGLKSLDDDRRDYLSQASSKLIRLRRAVPMGINHQMASELGHKVKTALKTLSSKVRSSSSGTVVQNLRTLEEAVNELLHTLFPGVFDAELTPVNSENSLISESNTTTELSSEQEFTTIITHAPLTHSHITPSHLSHHQDEVDYVPPSQHNPFAHSIKLESPTSKVSAWREAPVYQAGEELPLKQKSTIKKVKSTPDGQQEARVFVAVLDYEPKSMCVTGKPSNELSFNTGAVLAVYGNMDTEGYFTAQFEGKTGQVPANFIQEVDVSDLAMKNRLFNQTLGSPLPTDSYMVPSRHTLLTTPTETSLSQSYTSSCATTPGRPNPPTHFKVDKALGNSILMVTWQPPKMDSFDGTYSNGCLVTGYQLYVNGETKNLISGVKLTKATFVELNLSQSFTLGISTCAINGKSSKVVSYTYQPKAMSTVSSPSPEPEQYRTFIALYDYDPVKSSPCDHPEFELALSEGDILKVYGREMEDGFLVAELNGQRGLVPASFINEVKKPHVIKEDKNASANSLVLSSSTTPTPSPSKLPGTKIVMVASFDYNPDTDSPNPNPEMELHFKKGDQITVFGKMHGDGYYSGQLSDKFGLVPSNFLAKKPPTHPLSDSYETTTAPKKQATGQKNQHKEELISPVQPVLKQSEAKTKSPKERLLSPKTKSSPKGKSKKTDSPSDGKRKRQGFRWQKS